jgi:uncharacterized membrane protein
MCIRAGVVSALLLLTGCAGPLVPPLGLGSEVDTMFGVIFILLLGGLLYRGARVWRDAKRSESRAVHIAQARYAQGEITSEQFQQIMRDLFAPRRSN